MNKRPYAFLGQYLVGNGLITEDHLDEAIHLQKENHALVGAIALAQGYLDRAQLNHLIKRQREVDERIGRLALEEGFMTKDEVETVLSIQARNHIYLGESLVRLGTISGDTLNDALDGFRSQIVSQEQLVREEISELPMATETLVTLDVTLRFFYRLGYPIRVVGTSDRIPECFGHLYCSEQKFKKAGTALMGLGMADLLADSITEGPAIRERTAERDPDSMEAMSQLTFNLNYLVCKKLKDRGIRVKHGDAFIDTPGAHREGVCVEMETVTSPMVLIYHGRPSIEHAHASRPGMVRMAL